MTKYTVQSPIKMGGQRYAVGASIEMDGKAAAEARAQGLIAKEGETAAAIPPPLLLSRLPFPRLPPRLPESG